MRITLGGPGPDDRRELYFGERDKPGWFAWHATQHDLNDLEAVLAADKAMSRHCGAETTGPEPGGDHHTCVMPPGHSILPHICRGCPRQWRAGDSIAIIADDRVPPDVAVFVSERRPSSHSVRADP